MANLFFILTLIALIAFIVGLIKPKCVLMPNRTKSSLVYSVSFLILLSIFIAFIPSSDTQNQIENQMSINEQKHAQPQNMQAKQNQSEVLPVTQENNELCTKENEVYPDFAAAMTYFNDYTEEEHTLNIISENPLNVIISPQAADDDFPDVKDFIAKRAIIYGIYRAFINTLNDKVTVTSYLVYSDGKKLKNSPEYTTTITKQQALDIVKKYIPINSLSELTDNNCSFTMQFNELRFDDHNKKGFYNFFDELINVSK
ncbi:MULTISPECIES: hypothetical protein [Providencia]|uniref:hypothetical protein n=1 Tax=Providencia TaxID=586 RepID=UPI0008FB3F87|nr:MULTISPECIES: hypothetical protein [Providencia]APC13972.1 hypothetical protein RB151_043510 [Providencia rettgeri]EKH6495410.1 hypothetical protein [Providencia rettgeri]ELR5052679.1 hypothetical protein [Providencia rettgeri]ELR5154028.1 hypothetical protein [Providencia rettgeri]ELR5180595.1 hypothetical protein [Providencia rettgeri]